MGRTLGVREKLLVAAVWFGGIVGGWALLVGIVVGANWIRTTSAMPFAAVAVGLLGVLAIYRWDRT